MSEPIQAKLVLMEPGVQHVPPLAHPGEQTVLVLGPDESPDEFQERVRHCTDLLRNRSRAIRDVTYLVGNDGHASWSTRQRLLRDLCSEVSPEGSIAVLAPSGTAADVLGCLGDVQASLGRACALRAIFVDPNRS